MAEASSSISLPGLEKPLEDGSDKWNLNKAFKNSRIEAGLWA